MTSTVSQSSIDEAAASLSLPSRAFIDGRYLSPGQGAVHANLNPATGQPFGEIEFYGAREVDLAVQAARRAFNGGAWSRCAPEQRKEVLLRLAALVREHALELAVMESMDSGKPIKDCLHEIGTEVPNFFQWYGELTDKLFGKVVPTGEGTTALIVNEPIGVVGAVVPWNFPLLMATWKLAPALAAGCSVILKPAEQTPLSALRLAELATMAGLPDGVLNVIPGLGPKVGEPIGRHPGIDAVSFTGSNEVGALFLMYSAQSNMKPVGLEMGGKSPLIVLEDAAISEDLIEQAINAAFWNGGQNCSANMRQIVHQSRKAEFLDKILARVAGLRVGDPLDLTTEIGPMVSQEQRRRVLGYIAQGRADGARILAGGDADDRSGFFVRPTVFDEMRPEMSIAREEIFGPVLGVFGVKSVEEGLSLATDTNYGLHASVFTSDIDRALMFAKRLPCGTVSINGFSEGDVKTPFGGYRRSGSLARDKGVEALLQYTQVKTVWIRARPVMS
ncbi:aldehyde dehydrogenase [Roseateles violae]|uniref:Aldehyde dehydrogenase n=1 Tax=Roseateles violae TaxID=3058042 RepID=A0ABT8E017_9BURK|nr:aldehyde dehydrogenase [Pelomonas sp. PFR6]MDN3923206.1 aldehyde dehydrogenase [Pelomonas sp. PFR6]